MVLSSGGQYEMTQILLNGATATYVNILVVSGTSSSLLGVYSCDIWNGVRTVTMNITINGKYFMFVKCTAKQLYECHTKIGMISLTEHTKTSFWYDEHLHTSAL